MGEISDQHHTHRFWSIKGEGLFLLGYVFAWHILLLTFNNVESSFDLLALAYTSATQQVEAEKGPLMFEHTKIVKSLPESSRGRPRRVKPELRTSDPCRRM